MKRARLLMAALVLSACSGNDTAQAPPQSSGTIPVTSKSPEALTRFERGVDLLDNLRTPEAAAEFAGALSLDPDFVQARVYHGQATAGPDGLKEMENAAAAASGLPEAERVLVDAFVANRQGEFARANELTTRLTQLAPKDARSHFLLGTRLLNDRKYADAVTSLRRATELNPKAGGAQNMLGYAALRQGDTDGAVAAFTEYARILPSEPNPQDSLGEALLGAGKFTDAEAAFRKAAELAPQFWNAWEGIAYAKLYAGDQAGAQAALAKARAAAPRRVDKLAVETLAAAAAAARGNVAEAQKLLDAAEKMPEAEPDEVAMIPVQRAMVLVTANRARDARAPIAAALQRAESGQLAPGSARNVRREALRARVTAEVQLGDAAAAEKTSAMLDQDAAARPDDPLAQSAMHYGRGMLGLAKGDAAAARGHFDQCLSDDDYCKWQGILAAEKAGDAAAATAARGALLKVYARDPVHLIVRTRLAAPARRTT